MCIKNRMSSFFQMCKLSWSCMAAHVQLTVAVSVNKNVKISTLGIQFWVAADLFKSSLFVTFLSFLVTEKSW